MKKPFWDDGNAKKIRHDESAVRPSLGLVSSLNEIEPLYNPEEAAKVLRIELSTLYKFRCQGLIEATYQGRNIFFTAQQIADCRRRREQWAKKRR